MAPAAMEHVPAQRSEIAWALESGTSCLVHGDVREPSDTVATTPATQLDRLD
jgi:hypothetical protein